MDKKVIYKRERLLMDGGWRFHLGDFPLPKGHVAWTKEGAFDFDPVSNGYDDSKWQTVNLPHDFVVEGQFIPAESAIEGSLNDPSLRNRRLHHGFHASLPGGVGWYRKTFSLPAEDKSKRLVLEFDGIFRDSTVWLNNHYLGRNQSGYIGFRLDLTDVARCGGVNTLVIRVDAREYEGWFYEGGGIYRHAWLVKTCPLHIAFDGIFIASEVTERGGTSQAVLNIRARVRNDSDLRRQCQVVATIIGPAGKRIGRADGELTVNAGEEAEIAQTATVHDPCLWSVDTPVLYTLLVTVIENRRVVDECGTKFGVRYFRFDPDRGFFLNGNPLKLKGVCCHQDHAGVGSALPDRLQYFRIERLKEMGCNAYRCSHNPPTPELLDACDRLGMLVMDETRLLNSSPEYLSQLERLVLRDRNHPAVILWSLGNEEQFVQGTDAGARTAATMKRLVNKLDPTRPVTLAMNGDWGQGASQVVDVQGCNYISNGNVDEFHRRFPKKPIVYTESGSTLSTRGIYTNDAARCYVSAYDLNLPSWGETAEKNWRHCLARPFIAGTFVWTGFDYRGEPVPYDWPCVGSHFGIMDACGFPKDNFYYYQAWWSGKTVLHIFPHWNWPGHEGRKIDVWAYTNCDEVELFLNGKSLGRKRVKPASHLMWKVAYRPGVLMARGYKKDRPVAKAVVETTGAPHGIRLILDRLKLRVDGENVAVVRVEIIDRKGRLVPTAGNEVSFSVGGNARIIGVGNGDPSSHEPDKARRRRAFNGLCQVIMQATHHAGTIRLTAASPGLYESTISLQKKNRGEGKC